MKKYSAYSLITVLLFLILVSSPSVFAKDQPEALTIPDQILSPIPAIQNTQTVVPTSAPEKLVPIVISPTSTISPQPTIIEPTLTPIPAGVGGAHISVTPSPQPVQVTNGTTPNSSSNPQQTVTSQPENNLAVSLSTSSEKPLHASTQKVVPRHTESFPVPTHEIKPSTTHAIQTVYEKKLQALPSSFSVFPPNNKRANTSLYLSSYSQKETRLFLLLAAVLFIGGFLLAKPFTRQSLTSLRRQMRRFVINQKKGVDIKRYSLSGHANSFHTYPVEFNAGTY